MIDSLMSDEPITSPSDIISAAPTIDTATPSNSNGMTYVATTSSSAPPRVLASSKTELQSKESEHQATRSISAGMFSHGNTSSPGTPSNRPSKVYSTTKTLSSKNSVGAVSTPQRPPLVVETAPGSAKITDTSVFIDDTQPALGGNRGLPSQTQNDPGDNTLLKKTKARNDSFCCYFSSLLRAGYELYSNISF